MHIRRSARGPTRKAGAQIGLAGWIFLFTAALALAQSEIGEAISFEAGGRNYRVTVRAVPGGSAVFLQTAGVEKEISLGGGEDLFPAVKTLDDGFFVLWVHSQRGMMGFGFYDSRIGASRVFSLPRFSFLSNPTLVLQGREPRGIVFLGNASDNDDVYFLDLWNDRLVNLSGTIVSEKKFSMEPDDGGILISASTLPECVLYRLDLQTLNVAVRERRSSRPKAIPGNTLVKASEADPRILDNTYIAFGDSITWGEMRMNNLEGDYHPELAFPEKTKSKLAAFYGPAYPVNLGVPGDTTYSGVERIDAALEANPGLYFLLMLGTNDCSNNLSSIDSVIENLNYIVSRVEAKAMRAIISTIPPRKDFLGDLQYVKDRIAGLNAGIAEMAVRRKIGFVDTHQAFMRFSPPDGWKTLLEDDGGNHPSPDGHAVIAALFSDRLAAFPPRIPSGVQALPSLKSNQKPFLWEPCYESDFSFFRVEYGITLETMIFTATTRGAYFNFTILPFQMNSRLPMPSEIYFRIQAVDNAGRASSFNKFQTLLTGGSAPR